MAGAEGLPGRRRRRHRAGQGPTRRRRGHLRLRSLLGMSSYQFGMLARSNHKCQGAGQLRAQPGTGRAVYVLVDAEPKVSGPEDDVLAGVETSLSAVARFARGQEDKAPFLAEHLRNIEDQAKQAQEAYSTHAADRMRTALRAGLAGLVKTRERLAETTVDEARSTRSRRASAARKRTRARADPGPTRDRGIDGGRRRRRAGQSFTVHTRVWNQGMEAVTLLDVALRVRQRAGRRRVRPILRPRWSRARPRTWPSRSRSPPTRAIRSPTGTVIPRSTATTSTTRRTSRFPGARPTSCRWCATAARPGRARIRSCPSPSSSPPFFRYEGRWVGGEKQKVVNVVPALSISMTPEIAVMPVGGGARREFRSHRRQCGQGRGRGRGPPRRARGMEGRAGAVGGEPPLRGDEATARFFVTAPQALAAGDYAVRAVATRGGQEYRDGVQVIAYDHIQERHLLSPAASRVQAIDVKVAPACRSATSSGRATRCRPPSSSSASPRACCPRTTSPTATSRASPPSSPGSAPTRPGRTCARTTSA